MDEIKLKITIDGREAVSSIKITDDELKRLLATLKTVEASGSKNIDGISSSTKKLGDISKRDLGQFASQLLYSSGIAGRFAGHFSQFAAGLATGGIIGASLSGAAALIQQLTESTQKWNSALESAAGSLLNVKSGLEEVKFEISPEELNKLVNAFQSISDAFDNIISSGGPPIIAELFKFLMNLTGTMPEFLAANDAVLSVLKEQQIQLQANLLIADAYSKSLGYENFEAYKKFLELEKEKKKVEEEARKRAEAQDKLRNDLLLRNKLGLERELEDLRQKYEEEKKIASGNQQLLLMLEETYKSESLKIQAKYDKIKLNERLKYWENLNKIDMEKQKKRRERFAEVVTEKETFQKPVPEFINQSTEEIVHANFELGIMYDFSAALYDGFQSAAYALSSAGSTAIRIFDKANSVLQILINSLVQAVAEALIFRSVMGFLNFATGGVEGIFSNISGIASPASPVEISPNIPKISGDSLPGVIDKYLNRIDNWVNELEFKAKLLGPDIYLASERGRIQVKNTKL